jgi:uncharacterized protein (DUF2267 family)
MEDLRGTSMLTTTHQAYTMLQGVFQVFRRRLTVQQALDFAAVLPPVLRAIFVSDWNVEEPIRAFASREAMSREARDLRPDHNFSTESAIADVASALRRHVDAGAFERALAGLPPAARDFWAV